MNETMRRFVQAFGAGSLGGLGACLLLTLLHRAGIMDTINVTYHPGVLTTFKLIGPDKMVVTNNYLPWLYEGVVIYGLCGLAFLAPIGAKMPQINRALVWSLLPAGIQLLYMFPSNGRGYDARLLFGLEYGAFTFVFVLLVNATWGLIASTLAPSPE